MRKRWGSAGAPRKGVSSMGDRHNPNLGFGGSDLALPPTNQTVFSRLFYLFGLQFPHVSHGDQSQGIS